MNTIRLLPLALPEPVDSQLRRHGIEPWMTNSRDYDRCPLPAAERFDRMDAIELHNPRLTGTIGFDLLWDLPADAYSRTANGYYAFKHILGLAACDALRALRHELAMKKAAAVARLQAGRKRKQQPYRCAA